MNSKDKKKKSSELVKLSNEEEVKKIVVDTVFDLWKIVNNLTRLRPTKQEHYRVTMFGSARIKPNTFAYEQVKLVAKELAVLGCDIITGGGPGLMQAANEGASEANAKDRVRSVGIRVDLPFEQNVNTFVDDVFEHETFFSRLHHFVLTSDAFIIFPGGIGTILEATMIWQLLQVRKMKECPLIFSGKMWKGFLDWTKQSLITSEAQLVNPEDLQIPHLVTTADETIALIRKFHDKWIQENKGSI